MSGDFRPFAKIARLSRDVVITEKIDGTNGQIYINDSGIFQGVGSRNRWITPKEDNFGFARWAYDHGAELEELGPGNHFGEWWGQGIQRKYGLDHKRFSLFNTSRWANNIARPACCHVVPTLYIGPFSTEVVSRLILALRAEGSQAAPEFMEPEGIVIWHTAARSYFKKTLENDEVPKTLQR
jgi:hypothetical protein